MFRLARACPESEVLEGLALGGEAPEALRSHLNECGTCRAALERMRADNRFLSEFAVEGVLPAVPAAGPARPGELDVPGYEIVREIHRGGQGVVYQAVQRSTKREVAIKVMKEGPFATASDRARFEREIETLGRLEHPNIVAVHDAGVVHGWHYFVMNFVDGLPLDEFAEAGRSGVRGECRVYDVLRLFATVCDAVHAAHLRGVIHRDLKPSNIRVDRDGSPHVLDFGLAKALDAQRDAAMTRTGQFVGSLPWAAPEQVEGLSGTVDLRTDVYSLGAILYQLLTGSLPFDVGSNLRSAVDDILFREPRRPSTLAAGGQRIGDELDTIVLKCLSKERDRRYQTAGELARDVRRYLDGEPIEAKRDSAMYILRKTFQRYRMRVAAAGGFVLLLAVFGVVMALLYQRSAGLEKAAVHSAASLADLLSESTIEQGRMAGMLGNLAQAEQLLWREMLTHRGAGQDAAVHLNDPPGPPVAYWALWELYRRHRCIRTLAPAPPTERLMASDSEGTALWIADRDGQVRRLSEFGEPLDAWRASATFAVLPSIHAGGRVLLVAEQGTPCAWRRRDESGELLELQPRARIDASSIVISPSGALLAALVDERAAVWQLTRAAPTPDFTFEHEGVTAVAISSDERLLAGRDRQGDLHVWEIDSGRRIAHLKSAAAARSEPHQVGALLFSPDDRLVADLWTELPGRIWDRSAAAEAATVLAERPGEHRVASFSDDSRLLAVGGVDGALRVFDAHSGARVALIPAGPARIRSVAFTPGGGGVWSCAEGHLRLWDLATDPHVDVTRIEGDPLHGVDISPDGRWVFAGGGLGRLYRVNRATRAVESIESAGRATISSVAVSPDARWVAASTHGTAAYLWDASRLGEAPRVLAHPQRLSSVRFSPDGARLATACDDSVVRFWRVSDGALEREFVIGRPRLPQIAFDPARPRVAVVVRDGTLLMLRLDSGAQEVWAPACEHTLRAVEFSPDGRWLVSGGGARDVQVWDADSGRLVAALSGHTQEIYCLAFSPDGALIASGDSAGSIRVWHRALQRALATLDGHDGAVMALRFSPEGGALLSAALDGTVRTWDLVYYQRHIAGQVDVQLSRLGILPEQESPRADAWRAWAASAMRSPQP
ncbi:MAG: Serine/threonine-protein kinase PknD [Phycisphaerae bacterium]|nr:Serine/threonine-protein kinase PknD [Phycisphaerae bacterium]